MWQWLGEHNKKYQLMVGFALFRGMRIGEIVAINLRDFEQEYNKLRVILRKSHLDTTMPLLGDFTELLREYVNNNRHTMVNGWLFPTCKGNGKHQTSDSACVVFGKLRARMAKEHPGFGDWTPLPGNKRRFRIGWHSMRRYFETHVWNKTKDMRLIRDLMRYSKTSTVEVYINPYEIWNNERNILEANFSDVFEQFVRHQKGQKTLDAWT